MVEETKIPFSITRILYMCKGWSLLYVRCKRYMCVCLCLQALLQMVQSHDGSIRSVVEKGDALLASVHYPSIRDKMNRLQRDYTELCKRAMVRTCVLRDSGYDIHRGKSK